MATKAEMFVPNAMERALSIKRQMVALAQASEALRADYVACGGDAMDGISAYDWTRWAITETEFKEGMLDLSTTHNAIALSTLISGGGFAKVVKLLNGK